jgi:hypothetical protein
MTTLSLDSRQIHPGSFHFDLPGAVSAGAFAVAMIVCFRHGDVAAIPALVALAAMTLIVFSVHTPAATTPRGARKHRNAERTHLRRRDCLEQ